VVEAGDATDGEIVTLNFSPDLTPTLGGWSNYLATVARRVARNFAGPLVGADIALVSDLPPAAGMSSSSALMSGMFMVLAHFNRLSQRPEYQANLASGPALAGYLATIENGQNFGPFPGDRGVGTFGGSEDHTAICCCRPGELHLFAFCPVRQLDVIPFPKDYLFAIASSGVLAEKTGEAMAKYNRVSQLVSALLELWNTANGRQDRCLADAIHSGTGALAKMEDIVRNSKHAKFDSDSLSQRLRQFIHENERIIPAAARALAQADIVQFGKLVDESQRYTEDMLQNQIPQTIHLAQSARSAACGAVAASAFGAGFGGSVWAMVHRDRAEQFLAAWQESYAVAFPGNAQRATFFLTHPGPGMRALVGQWTMDNGQ
jgi:galactokinase